MVFSAPYKWRDFEDETDVFSQAFENALEDKGLYSLLYDSEALYIMYYTS